MQHQEKLENAMKVNVRNNLKMSEIMSQIKKLRTPHFELSTSSGLVMDDVWGEKNIGYII